MFPESHHAYVAQSAAHSSETQIAPEYMTSENRNKERYCLAMQRPFH
jgi:hypothetical protein